MEELEVTTKDIGIFKRKWKDRFKSVKYADEISKEENSLFSHDPTLLRLIENWKRAELNVLAHMDQKIELSRNEVI